MDFKELQPEKLLTKDSLNQSISQKLHQKTSIPDYD